jgi:hypothetical protein
MVGEQKYLPLEEECHLHHSVLEFKYQYTHHIRETATAEHYNLQYQLYKTNEYATHFFTC